MRIVYSLPIWFALCVTTFAAEVQRPHIILVMADDMGWGQTGYRSHPVLKTPHLDAMAANGLRFERFYAGAPVCSPTRASALTGRSNDRTGVLSHGYALRLQEKTMAQALSAAGYISGHFGKWHLNGLRGPGVPILSSDKYHPGKFGFDEWVSVSNFFDVNPLLSRAGTIEEFRGDSSEIIVDEAVKFLSKHRRRGKPIFAVIWFGTPHSPFKALKQDRQAFAQLNAESANHYGELAAMDRSIGTLREKLRELGLAENTLLAFCSDNGGLPKIEPETVGGLRGHKGSVYEGGLRVPGIIEWPAELRPRVTHYPACTMDFFPTIADLLNLPKDVFIAPIDGVSLVPLFKAELATRAKPIAFRFGDKAALIDNHYKLVTNDLRKGRFELYDLKLDPQETRDLQQEVPKQRDQLISQLQHWNSTVNASFAGEDYKERTLSPADPRPQFWFESADYQPYLSKWKSRWEYKSYLEPRAKHRK